MPPSLSELKVLPSFCFAFKIPDDVAASNTYMQWSWDLLTKEEGEYFHIPLCPPCSHCVASHCAPCPGVFQCLWAGRCLPLLFSLPLLSLLLLPVYLSIMPPRPSERPNKDHQSLQITYIGGPNIIRTCLPCLWGFSSNVFASSCSASSPPITHQQRHSKKRGKNHHAAHTNKHNFYGIFHSAFWLKKTIWNLKNRGTGFAKGNRNKTLYFVTNG